MVVNRRISVSTAPPVSRTASTQPAVRAPVPCPIPDVHDRSNGPKERKRSKVTKPERKKFVSYHGTLQVLLSMLSASLVYAAAVCPIGFARTLPLCKSLEFYRTQVIDPYVLPPIASVIQNTQPYIEPLKPYAASTVDFARTRIIPHMSAFVGSCLSYCDAEVARIRWLIVDRLWNGVIIPSYFDVLHPTLKRHIHPFYNNYLAPGIGNGIAYAQAIYFRALPHAQHRLLNARKNAVRIYKIVRPHVVNFYVRLRPHVMAFLDQAYMLILVLAQNVGDLRREFVDPHVRKILDTVAERQDPFLNDSLTDG